MAGLRADGRVLLGGDLDLRLNHREATAEQLAWLQDHGQVSTIAGLRTMAKATGPEASRKLVELRAVDGLYPLYGETVLAPPVTYSADGEQFVAVASGKALLVFGLPAKP